jgi:Cu-processing system permease protein
VVLLIFLALASAGGPQRAAAQAQVPAPTGCVTDIDHERLPALLAARGFAAHALSLLQSVYLTGLELALIAALAVMFSALSTPVLSALYTLGAYLVGQWSDDLRAYAEKLPPALASTMQALANLVPNLPLFNMRTLAANGETTSLLHLGLATAYALAYCACVLSLAAAAFESRDFK